MVLSFKLLLVCLFSVATSLTFFRSGLRSVRRFGTFFASPKEDGQDFLILVNNLIQSKDEQLRAKDGELQRALKGKDEQLRAKDGELLRALKGKDDVIQAKDGELLRALKGKDDVIQAKDDVIRAKNDELHRLIHGANEKLAETTAELWQIQGKLNLRNAIENFEKRAPLGWKSEAGNSDRERQWKALLKANTSDISTKILNDTREMTDADIARWVRAAQELYKSLSASIHLSNENVVIIDASRLRPDPLTLARCIVAATPLPARLLGETDGAAGDEDRGDGGGMDVAKGAL
jgi:hypothetical protein